MPRTHTFRNVEGLTAALKALPKAAVAEMRDASVEIASHVSADAASKARTVGGVAGLVVPSIRGTRDRVPRILMGSTRKLPAQNGIPRRGPHQTIGDIIWGAEFGGGGRPETRQFKPWRKAGYFLWPTITDEQDYILDAYGDALMNAVDKVAR